MHDVAVRSMDVATAAGLGQALPPSSILRGLPEGDLFATHLVSDTAILPSETRSVLVLS